MLKLLQESGLQQAISPEKVFDSDWKELFFFLSDRLSSVKQEFIISALGPEHLPILYTIANFYLFAMLDPNCHYHKCYSEAYSSVCCAAQVHRTKCKDSFTLDDNIFIYHFFLNLDDSVLMTKLLKENDITRYPLSLCLEVYKCYKFCNYHRFWKLWDSLDCLKQAALSRHAKSLGKSAESVIYKAYKSKNLRYPENKFQRYTCMPATEKYNVDSKGINFSGAQKTDQGIVDDLRELPYNISDLPDLDGITGTEQWETISSFRDNSNTNGKS